MHPSRSARPIGRRKKPVVIANYATTSSYAWSITSITMPDLGVTPGIRPKKLRNGMDSVLIGLVAHVLHHCGNDDIGNKHEPNTKYS